MRGSTANGPNIRRRRKRLGLTQEELANRAGVDVKTIRNAEANRNLDAGTLQRIALVLSVELSYVSVTSSDSDRKSARRIRAVQAWVAAYNRRDVDGMVAIYHDDAEVVYPSADTLPGGGTFTGTAQQRRQADEFFNCIETQHLTEPSVRIQCVGEFVYLRASAIMTVRKTGVALATEILLEFEFNDEKVKRHVALFDTAGLIKAL